MPQQQRDRPASDVLMDPPNRLRASDVNRGEISHMKFIIGFHAMARCGGDIQGCKMPFLHSYIESSLDLAVSVGYKNSKTFSETATKENWERPLDRSDWHRNGEPGPGQEVRVADE